MSASVSHELYREFRRHAGNERLPFELRQRLRQLADRSHARTVAAKARVDVFPRRLLRSQPVVRLPPKQFDQARTRASACGVVIGAPLVTFESRTRPDIASAIIEFLLGEGYGVARVGDHPESLRSESGVVDLSTIVPRSSALETFLISASAFAICESPALQQLACRTNTPCLTINANDPFIAYPVRANGLFILRTAIDLDAAMVIAIDDELTERYFRNLRNCGYRDNTASEIIDAVKEMQDGIRISWTSESESQARFRRRVADAGTTLATTIPYVARWGPDAGFIGDGRLVRFQADRVS
jgi:putative glycosyltransferase (TIGR04372 family)